MKRTHINTSLLISFFIALGLAATGCGSDAANTETDTPSANEGGSDDTSADPNLIDGVNWPGAGWTSTLAEEVGLNQAGLDQMRDYAFTESRNTQALLIVYQGQLIGEWYGPGYNKDSLATSWSVAKSFLSVLFGIAIDQGLLASLDETVGQYLPEWADDSRGSITIRQLLQMQSGLSTIDEDIYSEADQLAYALNRDLADSPTWTYANSDSMVLGRILEMVTSMDTEAFARQELFEPIGMSSAVWWRDFSGQPLTYCCIDATPRDFARFGLMATRLGAWRDSRVISSEFLDESYEPQEDAYWYGLHWWTYADENLRFAIARGYHEQLIYVFPDSDLVVLRFGVYNKVGEGNQLSFTNYHSTQAPSDWDDQTFLGYTANLFSP